MKPDPRLAGQDGEFMEISKVKYAPSSMANPEPRWYGVCYVETPSMAGTAQPFRLTLFREDIAAFKEYSHDTSAFDRKDYGEHALVKPIPVTAWTYDGLRRVETIFDDEMQPHDGPTKLRAHTNGKAQRRIGTEPPQMDDSSEQEKRIMVVNTPELETFFRQEAGKRFNPVLRMGKVSGNPYLEVIYRIIWFWQEHPDWTIDTQPFEIGGLMGIKAQVFDDTGRLRGSGLSTITVPKNDKKWADKIIEKAETAAIGRALGRIGYNTANAYLRFSDRDDLPVFADDESEGDHLADSPIDMADPDSGVDAAKVAQGQARKTKAKTAPANTNPQTGEVDEAQPIYNTLRKLSPRPVINTIQDVQDILDEMKADQVINETDSSAVKTWYTLINLATVNKRQMWHLDFNAVFVAIANEIGVDLEETDVTPDLWFAKDADGKAKRGIQDLWTLLTNLYDAKLRASTLGATGTEG